MSPSKLLCAIPRVLKAIVQHLTRRQPLLWPVGN